MTRRIHATRDHSSEVGGCTICSRTDAHKVTRILIPADLSGRTEMVICDRCAPFVAREFIRTGSHLRGTDNVGGPDR